MGEEQAPPRAARAMAADMEVDAGLAEDEAEAEARERAAARLYAQWKALIPYMYDWFSNDNRAWPSLSCRWGAVLEKSAHKTKQRAYFAEQTDGTTPNTLIVASMQVLQPRVAQADYISTFSEETRSPFVTKSKTLIHPGEVNKIREFACHPSLIATSTDSPEAYLWNTSTQDDRAKEATRQGVEVKCSCPDLVLAGHTAAAPFALATAAADHKAASGGADALVALWDVSDHTSTLCATAVDPQARAPAKAGGDPPGPRLDARMLFRGHTANIEDVCFCADDSRLLASVGDDGMLALWDERAGGDSMADSAPKAHTEDVHAVDWSPHDANLIVTGGADGVAKVWDRRSLGKGCVGAYEYHDLPILRVQWNPDAAGFFTSGGQDGRILIWDTSKDGSRPPGTQDGAGSSPPPAVLFQHNGHRAEVVDFHWNPYSAWTMLSVSNDTERNGGSTMQMWRVSDLLYRPEEEMREEIQGFRELLEAEDAAKGDDKAAKMDA